MRFSVFSVALSAVLLSGTCAAIAQGDGVADPGAFPLADKAGVDGHADKVAPAGAVNQGAFDMTKWKFGHDWMLRPARRYGILSRLR